MTDETVPGMADAIAARMSVLHLSPGAFARAAGLTAQGLAPVRRGDRREYQAKVRNGVARALQWPGDWYDRLLRGEDATTFADTDHQAVTTPAELLQAVRDLTEVVRELREDMRRGRT